MIMKIIQKTLNKFFIFFGIYNLNILFVGLITSLACQAGDLFFSFIKRKAKFNDFGKYLRNGELANCNELAKGKKSKSVTTFKF